MTNIVKALQLMQTSQKFDIAILGGSYIGLSAALFMSQLGLSVALIEINPLRITKKEREPSRLLAIAQSSINAYSSYAGCSLFETLAEPIRYIRVLEEGVSGYLDFDPDELGLRQFGVMIDEHTLLNRLYSAVCNRNSIKLFYECKSVSFEAADEGTYITLCDGMSISAGLTIVCDGRNSSMRKALGIGTQKSDYHQSAIVCDIDHEYPHEGAAIEKFTPSGPFAILPKPGGYSSAIVWTCARDQAKALLELDSEVAEEIITQKFGPHLGKLCLSSNIASFPLHLVNAKRYIAKRTALVGDAAHGIHPLAGQGLNLGIRDIATLRDLVKTNLELGLDIGSELMLLDYERLRKSDSNLMIEATHQLNGLFGTSFIPIKIMRAVGLSFINKAPIIKKTIMRYAVGI